MTLWFVFLSAVWQPQCSNCLVSSGVKDSRTFMPNWKNSWANGNKRSLLHLNPVFQSLGQIHTLSLSTAHTFLPTPHWYSREGKKKNLSCYPESQCRRKNTLIHIGVAMVVNKTFYFSKLEFFFSKIEAFIINFLLVFFSQTLNVHQTILPHSV